MSEEETIQVNPSDLSDEVLNDLVDEADISREEAQEFADQAQLDQIQTADPVEKDILESTKIKSNFLYERFAGIYNKWHSRTAKADIVNVEPIGDDYIVLEVHHSHIDRKEIRFSHDSVELANLMAYHGASSPSELEGNKILLNDISKIHLNSSSGFTSRRHRGQESFLIPNNVSFAGKLRYKAFSSVQNIRSLTKVKTDIDPFEMAVFGSLGYFTLLVISSLVAILGSSISEASSGVVGETIGSALVLPFSLLFIFGAGILFYAMIRGLLYPISKILEGGFHEN